ncbi:MAG: efflux RND transporter periplasmic adaptor subunit, partial [Aureliella sp.]
AQEEYWVALKSRSQLTRDPLVVARTKLELFNISPEQINELDQCGTAKRTLTLTSPHTGTVMDKNANGGMKI